MNLCIFGRAFLFFLVGACLIEFSAPNASAQYTVTNLVANETYLNAQTQDPGLINAGGLAAFPSSPFWVSAQNSSTSRLYTGSVTTEKAQSGEAAPGHIERLIAVA
jgi:hypothetical protein